MWRLGRRGGNRALRDPGVERALPRYVDIVRGEKLPKFMIARRMPAPFDPSSDARALLFTNSRLLGKYMEVEAEVDQGLLELEEMDDGSSFLDLKIEIAKRIMAWCRFCERRCGVNRLNGERGYCGCGDEFSVASAFPHTGEEPELVPSGTVFTYGCTIKCIHCQNWDISQWHGEGRGVDPSGMADIVDGLKGRGCINLNMVGGEPTPHTYLWLETMMRMDASMATVWNSNSYYSRETAMLLAGVIDLYLLDFKYGNDDCAEAISDAPGYWDASTRNHLLADRYGELIIRVLVLPGHNQCCTKPILEWISDNLGPWTRVNLMFQYRPEWRADERPELSRRLSGDERREALRMAEDAGLKNFIT